MKLTDLEVALAHIAAGATAHSLEDEHLDFKQDPATIPAPHTPGNPQARLVEMLVEAVICFSNAEGGLIVLGVADRVAGPNALMGTPADVDFVRRRIWANTQPNLPVDVHEYLRDGIRLIVIDVPEGLGLYTDNRGRAVRREGTACVVMPEAHRQELSFRRRDPDYTARRSHRTLADVDQAALAQARQLLRRLGDLRSELAALNDTGLLRGMGVMDDAGHLLVAGEILMCGPSTDVAVYLHRESVGSEPSAARLRQPLVLALPALLARVRDNSRPEFGRISLSSGQEIAIPDFPPVAVDEAVTNALVHRDWGLAGEVVVDHSPQTLRVWSPGSLPMGVSRERLLTTVSHPRNASLMSAVRTLGLAEATSRGIDRMYREMIKTGRDAPVITADDFSVEVAFTSGAPNRAFATFVASLDERLRDNVNVLLVLDRLCARPGIDATYAAELMQVDEQEAARILEWAGTSEVGLLTRDEARVDASRWRLSAAAHAGLGTAVSYRARGEGGREQVLAHLAEYGWITNRTVRNLFSLDVQQARALLSDLRKDGVVIKDPGGPARGPGVQWLPGPHAKLRQGRRTRRDNR